MMVKRIRLFTVILLCLMLFITACKNEKLGESITNKTQDQLIKVGVLPIEDNLPFFVAESEDLYNKNNVKVELVPFSSARERDIALEAGEIDAELADLIAVGLIKKGGKNVKAVTLGLGVTPAEGRFAILAAPNSSIQKAEDLKGVPIAISNNTIIHYLAEKMPQEVGMLPEDIKTQAIPDMKLRLDSLLEGKDVQAALLPDPLATLAEKSGARVIIDDTTLPSNLSQTVILFDEEVINNQEEDVANLLKAYTEASTKLNNEPEKYRALIIEKARIPKPLENSYPAPTYSPLELPSEEMIGKVMDWMVSKELLARPYSYEEIVDTRFLKP
ncbi:MAG: MetQ/NlpA family ABC transporter substrate-binding protein [Bacillota bacterium]